MKMHMPQTIQVAFEKARWQVQYLSIILKQNKAPMKLPPLISAGSKHTRPNDLSHKKPAIRCLRTVLRRILLKVIRESPPQNFSTRRITTCASGVGKNFPLDIAVRIEGYI